MSGCLISVSFDAIREAVREPLPQIVHFECLDHVDTGQFIDGTRVQLETPVVELGKIDVLYLEPSGYHPRDVDVLQLEEGARQRRFVERIEYVVRQHVGRTRVEIWIQRRPELSRRYVVLGRLVADGLPLLAHFAHYGALLVHRPIQYLKKDWHVDVHVVVGLQKVFHAAAVVAAPLQHRYRLQRQIVVRVDEISLDDVTVNLVFRFDGLVVLGIGRDAHHKGESDIAAKSHVTPRAPHGFPLLAVTGRRRHQNQQLHSSTAIGANVFRRHFMPRSVESVRRHRRILVINNNFGFRYIWFKRLLVARFYHINRTVGWGGYFDVDGVLLDVDVLR